MPPKAASTAPDKGKGKKDDSKVANLAESKPS